MGRTAMLLEITILERLPMITGDAMRPRLFRYLVYLRLGCRPHREHQLEQVAGGRDYRRPWFRPQEIFATSFRLIILFERPIRVGDLVTVNGVTGSSLDADRARPSPTATAAS
jgi:hypothetical protein